MSVTLNLALRIPSRTLTALELAEAAAIEATQLAVISGSRVAIPPTAWRVHDAIQTNLPATPAADDLGIDGGTFATSVPIIKTGDAGSTNGSGGLTQRARTVLTLPPNYKDGEPVSLIFLAGVAAAASESFTLDVQAFRVGDDGLVDGSDLYTGAAQDINSVTFDEISFTLSPTALVAGDSIDVRITMFGDDIGGSGKIGKILAAWLAVDTQG